MNNDNAQLSASQFELVVSSKTIGSLTTNAKAIKQLVDERIKQYDISSYSSNDIAKCKEDKAVLNKAAKALNDKRIALEKEWNTPFEEFKETIKETVDTIKLAASNIDAIIKKEDEKQKAAKYEEIKAIAERVGLTETGVSLSLVFSSKWNNKTTSIKSIEKELTERVKEIRDSLKALGEFGGDIATAAIARYKEDLSLTNALTFANKMQSEKAQAKDEQTQETVSESTNQPEPNQVNVSPAPQSEPDSQADSIDAFNDALGIPPVVRKPVVFPKSYTIYATEEQFSDIEQYLTDKGLNFTNE